MRHTVFLVKDDLQMIKVLYESGLTQKKLSEMYKVGIKIVRKILRNQYKIKIIKPDIIGPKAEAG